MKEGLINPPFFHVSVSRFNEYRFGFLIEDWFCGFSKKSNKYRELSFIVNIGFEIPSGATPFVWMYSQSPVLKLNFVKMDFVFQKPYPPSK